MRRAKREQKVAARRRAKTLYKAAGSDSESEIRGSSPLNRLIKQDTTEGEKQLYN